MNTTCGDNTNTSTLTSASGCASWTATGANNTGSYANIATTSAVSVAFVTPANGVVSNYLSSSEELVYLNLTIGVLGACCSWGRSAGEPFKCRQENCPFKYLW